MKPSSKDFLKSIGKKLQAIRLSKNISPKTAAHHLRISVSRLQAIESGEKDYSLDLLMTLCDYYEVSILDVIEE